MKSKQVRIEALMAKLREMKKRRIAVEKQIKAIKQLGKSNPRN